MHNFVELYGISRVIFVHMCPCSLWAQRREHSCSALSIAVWLDVALLWTALMGGCLVLCSIVLCVVFMCLCS